MSRRDAKQLGAYYTPPDVVASLVAWAARDSAERMLDPSCGDGRFLAAHHNSVGIEQDAGAAREAKARAPGSLVHEGEFFAWAASTAERFHCAAGNPPFIRYQSFKGRVREEALALCGRLGARFSGLASSWAPFLVATAALLRPGGRMAFVVPAEIGHAPYAAPVIEYLARHFREFHILAVRQKLFAELSEDCWLLFADGFGGRTDAIGFSALERFEPSTAPPRPQQRIPLADWRGPWRQRLRPFLLSPEARSLYLTAQDEPGSRRLGEIAAVGIGYVSGANDFFHLRPSLADRLGIPRGLLLPSVRNARALPSGPLTRDTVRHWHAADEPMLLLNLRRGESLPDAVRAYLDSEDGHAARQAYKCRMRDPWYAVPDVQVPDLFLNYMSGRSPHLVANAAGCTCTNSIHAVRLNGRLSSDEVLRRWDNDLVRLSCEIEGHALGGGMLKLEPREAGRLILPAKPLDAAAAERVTEAVATLRRWRHHAT